MPTRPWQCCECCCRRDQAATIIWGLVPDRIADKPTSDRKQLQEQERDRGGSWDTLNSARRRGMAAELMPPSGAAKPSRRIPPPTPIMVPLEGIGSPTFGEVQSPQTLPVNKCVLFVGHTQRDKDAATLALELYRVRVC